MNNIISQPQKNMSTFLPNKYKPGDTATFKLTDEKVLILGILDPLPNEMNMGQKYLIRLQDFSKLQVFSSELLPFELK